MNIYFVKFGNVRFFFINFEKKNIPFTEQFMQFTGRRNFN